jgi:cation diffusion facilitator family transporter
MVESKGVVIAAFIANAAIAILKFVGFLLTGSASMLAETYHSISDTGNQIFLFIGIRYSSREPDRSHPFGYGKAQFFYSFLVAVLLFGIAGWESLRNSYQELTAGGGTESVGEAIHLLGFTFDPPTPFPPFYINIGILVAAALFEGYAWTKARNQIQNHMESYGWSSYWEAFRQTSDVTSLTALTEDSLALVGILLALFGVITSEFTEDPVYDAVAGMLIGILLMGFALLLAWENKRLLIGESLDDDVERSLRSTVREHRGVKHVDQFRTVFFGPEKVLVTADVSFDPDLQTGDIDEDITQIEEKLKRTDERVKMVYLEPEI